ncbi:MAG: AAA family ATPase [Eubacterium sp.]|nr:AAA family ATPase [Eubacterium sp.]
MTQKKGFPFTAIVGQESMKEALILNLIDPSLGGVLIRGQKGTAKTTAVRALAEVLPSVRVVELPINATEDRVTGTLDMEHALKTGEKKFEPGLLAEADKNILYVDEVNLLEDHLVDILLDAAATGVNTVEREGLSYAHPARFALVGTMNPEEGNLRPQLLDRFGLVVDVAGEQDPVCRARIIENRLAYEADAAKFRRGYAAGQKALAQSIRQAKKLLPEVTVDAEIILLAAKIGIEYGTEGHRADISMIKTARAIAALRGSQTVAPEDLKQAALYTLPHRMRKGAMDKGQFDPQKLSQLTENAKPPAAGQKEAGKKKPREASVSPEGG